MSTLDYRFIFCNILLIFITLSQTAPLDGPCSINTNCDQPDRMICRNQICQCDSPWYIPCNGRCDMQINLFYEGDGCRHQDNCMTNARCDNASRQCVCRTGFTSINGLCYKLNNESCTTNNDCWSNYCNTLIGRCACNDGYELLSDGRCQRKLARLYENWSQANQSNDFCIDDLSCLNLVAICATESGHSEKFCQCPTPGYFTDINSQQCNVVEIQQLSPVNGPTSNDNTTCIHCSDINAVCASHISNRETCWCRAGHDNIDNICQSIRYKFIFPSATDSNQHSYASDCNNNNSIINSSNMVVTPHNNLCTCGNFYEFDTTTRLCKNIERRWISEYFEYGICTRITSNGIAQTPSNALCPPPLECRFNGDQYVCSCGQDRMLEDLSNGTRKCVFRLNKSVNGVNPECPQYAVIVNNTCQCRAGFKQMDVDRRCELILLSDTNSAACPSSGSSQEHQSCIDTFGIGALFCSLGECRCSLNVSFANSNNTRCYGLLNVPQAGTIDCPENSLSTTAANCQCGPGYRNSSDRQRCEPKSRLHEWGETGVHIADLGPNECAAVYGGLLAPHNSTFSFCQCDANSFVSPNGTQCWPELYANFTRTITNCLIPNATLNVNNSRQCICDTGFRPSNSRKRDCRRISALLSNPIDNIVSDVHPINDVDCRELFGPLSMSNNSRCICRVNGAFPNNEGTRCYALLDTNTGLLTLGQSSCPNYASTTTTPGTCECNPGFITSSTRQQCLTADIPLTGSKLQISSGNCGNYTNNNCIAKYGNDSFCENNQCWCNGLVSFKMNDNRCERFSRYIFPGVHERNNVSCDIDTDCINDNVDINTVECKRIYPTDDYKVCVCKEGWFLNPELQRCETRCEPTCNDRPNRECIGYDCRCKSGFIEVNNTCIQNPNVLELYKPCNGTFFAENNNPFRCSLCGRGECTVGYQDTGFQCVRLNFATVRCISTSPNICNTLNANSECLPIDNKCVCSTGFYLDNDKCARPIDYRCNDDVECGTSARCLGHRCRCTNGTSVVNILDAFGRSIQRCTSATDRIQWSPVVLVFFVFVRLFFA